jgi:teichuronic acid biosynthesis glycosyltransferase TuaH
MSRYSDWTESGVVNRNYHILQTLAKDERVNKIIAVDFLPFNWKRALKTIWKDQIKKDRRGEVLYGDLTTQAWQVSSKVIVYSTFDSVLNKKNVVKKLNNLTAKVGMRENLIVWNFNPLFTNYFDLLNQKLNIFDAVDNWIHHSSYASRKKLLTRNYRITKEKSDLIYTVSQDLKEFFDSPKAKWLPNAVDFDHFQTQERIESLEKIDRPIIGFLGILQDRIDIDLLESVAQTHSDKTLVLAGPVWQGFPKARLEKLANVIFSGAVRYEDIPKYYNSFDVGIIAYKGNEFIKSTNSMKYYEYLAAGLPVVSTMSGGIEDFKDVIYTADTYDRFNVQISAALEENSITLEQKRRDFVKPMSWEARIGRVFKDIEDKLA